MKFICIVFSIAIAFSNAKISSHMKSDKISDCLHEHSDTINIMCFERSNDNKILSNTSKAECRNHGPFEKNEVNIVKFINCEMDSIPDILFETYTKLKELDVSYMKLTSFNVESIIAVRSLEKFKGSHNHLREIPSFPTASNIKDMDLSFNWLTILKQNSFIAFEKLENLNLSHTHLREISSGVFRNQEHLRSVDLSGNHLKFINMQIFLPSFYTLKSLRLDDNKLSEQIEDPREMCPFLRTITLDDNPPLKSKIQMPKAMPKTYY